MTKTVEKVPVTLWYKFAGKWKYNHLQLGHVTEFKPVPQFDSQQGWLKEPWLKFHVWMEGIKVLG